MDDAELQNEVHFWLAEAHSWPCTCRGAEMLLCDRCLIHSSLEAAAGHVRAGDWSAAHRAVRRAAGIDGRLVALRDELEERVLSPYEQVEIAIAPPMAEGSGPLVLPDRHQDPGVTYPCGLTYREHKELLSDVILREEGISLAQWDDVGPLGDKEGHGHLVRHLGCRSTFVYWVSR